MSSPTPEVSRVGAPLIRVRTGAGSGRTRLAAFDAALRAAGTADYNLTRLSSVIPEGSAVVRSSEPLGGRHGDRLWCVLSSVTADQHGEIVWAGLGWALDAHGRGLFVEHHGGSKVSLEEQIHLSLEDMSAGRGGGYDRIEIETVSAHCVSDPVCAVAVAAYQVQGWGEDD